ncbi:retinoid-inducible serine carboxypeptidase-like [Belonocnema kinseyi]|uniref:retinoid-inducible serine carboxypeptidase-like n=1 Tax=Belonocnema kinseyi TaxID=2817044 RepID=UPI00143DA5FC|nr:retinoid-inducible serine carboxypeptidase-like [Belonocnema kinseyi]XP_033223609.1 retinoid-inducible serine carboxypeptidase-like [Belonocnema kinseyi]
MLVKTIILIVLLGVFDISYAKKGFGSSEQEWGFVNVRPKAHMFWWLYYTTADVPTYYEKPLVIWLQGGPGASSTGYGNFEEIGPLDRNLKNRNYTWVKDYNVLFIDNPVGSGFSYTTSSAALAKNNQQIASDLLVCIENFLEQFPRFAQVPTYITSESYGGKMAAEFAYIWYKAQKSGSIRSNLKGVGLGDSWISPIDSVLTWAPFLLQTGMVDTQGYQTIMKSANQTRAAVEAEEWELATELWSMTESIILNMTNNIDFYNILYKTKPSYNLASQVLNNRIGDDGSLEVSTIEDLILEKLMNFGVKKALRLNSTWGEQSSEVFYALLGDFMKPVIDTVELLLNETDINVFVYNGQLDLIVDTPGTLLWVEKLKWKNDFNWKRASRKPVVVNNIIEGYVKASGNFKMYWINRAGHMVPTDNPAGTAAMLKDLTSDAQD